MQWFAELASIAPFIMIIFVVWFGTQLRRSQDRHRADTHKELISKLSSAQEVNDFLKTDAGKQLIAPSQQSRSPSRRAGTGVLIIVVGLGIFAASNFMHYAEAHEGLMSAGVIASFAGIGFLLSAVISRHLSQKWGESDEKR